jgi:hypothetical protein
LAEKVGTTVPTLPPSSVSLLEALLLATYPAVPGMLDPAWGMTLNDVCEHGDGVATLPPITFRTAGRELYHFTSETAWPEIARRGETLSAFWYFREVLGMRLPRVWLGGRPADHAPFVWLTQEGALVQAYPAVTSAQPKEIRIVVSPHALVAPWPEATAELGIDPRPAWALTDAGERVFDDAGVDWSLRGTYVIPERLPLSMCLRAERVSDGEILWENPSPPEPPAITTETVELEIPVVELGILKMLVVCGHVIALAQDIQFASNDMSLVEDIVRAGRLPNHASAEAIVEILQLPSGGVEVSKAIGAHGSVASTTGFYCG